MGELLAQLLPLLISRVLVPEIAKIARAEPTLDDAGIWRSYRPTSRR